MRGKNRHNKYKELNKLKTRWRIRENYLRAKNIPEQAIDHLKSLHFNRSGSSSSFSNSPTVSSAEKQFYIMDSIWLNICIQLEISEDVAKKWFKNIEIKMSTESHRFFHSWNETMLKKEEFLNYVSPIIILAVVFQYYEFDVKRNCVEKNCDAFMQFCNDANFNDNNAIKMVRKLLGDDSIEEYPGYENDVNIFQDLDLVVLGSSPEEYKNYIQLLRKEYTHLDDASYCSMRLKVLQTFLTIPTIFLTPELYSRFEEIARQNIKDEIEILKNDC